MIRSESFANRLRSAPICEEPFPHLQAYPAFEADDFEVLRSAFPPVAAFDVKGRGLKLELDVVEEGRAFAALTEPSRAALLALRESIRNAIAPVLIDRFRAPILEKYTWLLGEPVASEVLAAGLTTTNGRIMGRAPGYRLDAHLDSAHFAVTCLLYFSTVETPEAGALCLYRPERALQVLHASTYYPAQSEGVEVEVAKTIPVRENLFVAFVNGPRSLHGFSRSNPGGTATDWRFVYQCHIVPRDFDIGRVAPTLTQDRLARWADYVDS